MSTEQPAVVVESAKEIRAAEQRSLIHIGKRGLELRTLDDLWRFAQFVAKSGLAPKSLDSAEKILVAIQTGNEAGLGAVASLRSIVVINGVPSWKGDMALALVRSSGKMIHFSAYLEGEGEARRAVVTTQRIGQDKPVVHTFSVADAKRARLWGKQGPWTEYPDRMLRYRALGFALRDQFSDVLQGGVIAEEAGDFPTLRDVTPAEVPQPKLPPASPDPLMAQLGAAPAPVEKPIMDDGEPNRAEYAEPQPVIPFPSHAEADRAIAEEEEGR